MPSTPPVVQSAPEFREPSQHDRRAAPRGGFSSSVFTVVLLLLLVTWRVHHKWPAYGALVVLVLLVLALWRYMEQRFKATNQAYWSVITLTAQGARSRLARPTRPSAARPHSVAWVFRKRLFRSVRYF